MRKWLLLLPLALVGIALVPEAGEARGWRRCCPAPCPPPCCPPPWYYPPPCPPVVYMPYCRPPARPGTTSAPPVAANLAPAPAGRAVTIKGKTYQIFDTRDPGLVVEEKVNLAEAPFGASFGIPGPDGFQGTARAVAKTTIADADLTSFDSVTALRKTLKSDDAMMALSIPSGPNVDRFPPEKGNVQVKGFIYAFRKESDNDYHVIIGDPPGAPNPSYLNAEVSGIPKGGTDANRAKLWAVRKAFKEAFSLGDQGPNSYFRPQPPVPVQFTGSLFWDVEHPPPHTVGPHDFSPGTAWEIHPISEIVFLD
jgi:hypothetical protein